MRSATSNMVSLSFFYKLWLIFKPIDHNLTFLSYFCINGMKIAYLRKNIENAICIMLGNFNKKGFKMYECNIIEAEDFGFNHYIHHIDEYEEGYYIFTDEFDCEIDEDIIWE